MHRPVEILGKVGNTVYGKNRYGQTCYALVIPANPRTAPQQANRHQFGGVGSTWHLLTDEQRALWQADGHQHRTHGRPGRHAPLTGFQRYMQVNATRARQGLPPLEVPAAAFPRPSQAPLPRLAHRAHLPRVPMGHRTKAVVTRWAHPWPPLNRRAPPESHFDEPLGWFVSREAF